MKLSLDSIGYGGYFTAPGEQANLEEAMKRAARFGYDAICIYAHRPMGFPMDIDANRYFRGLLIHDRDPFVYQRRISRLSEKSWN